MLINEGAWDNAILTVLSFAAKFAAANTAVNNILSELHRNNGKKIVTLYISNTYNQSDSHGIATTFQNHKSCWQIASPVKAT
jgi:hypothetical protein